MSFRCLIWLARTTRQNQLQVQYFYDKQLKLGIKSNRRYMTYMDVIVGVTRWITITRTHTVTCTTAADTCAIPTWRDLSVDIPILRKASLTRRMTPHSTLRFVVNVLKSRMPLQWLVTLEDHGVTMWLYGSKIGYAYKKVATYSWTLVSWPKSNAE